MSTGGAEITVIIPAYQAESFLPATLAAVGAQTVQPAEIIIIDDGSTDGTVSVAQSFSAAHRGAPVRVLREPHRGPGATRNAGIFAARTEWLAFLDSDDIWQPDKLRVVSDAIERRPDANLFCHNEVIRLRDGTERVSDYSAGFREELPVPIQLYLENHFSTSAVVCRRDLVLAHQGFDETLSSAQDYELWLRMSPDLTPVFIPQALGTYVLRQGNITTTRFWRRLRNALRVKHRHRDKVGFPTYAYATTRVMALHLAGPLRSLGRRALPRLGKR